MTKAVLALATVALSYIVVNSAAGAADDSKTPQPTDSVIQDRLTHTEPGINSDSPSNTPLANLAQEAIGDMMALGDILTGDLPPPPGKPMPSSTLKGRLAEQMALSGGPDGAPSLEGHMGMPPPDMAKSEPGISPPGQVKSEPETSPSGMAMGGPGMGMPLPGMAMGGPGMAMPLPGMAMGGPGMAMPLPGMAMGGPGMGMPLPGMAMGCPLIRAHRRSPLALLEGPYALSDDQYQKLYDIKGQFIANLVPRGLNMYILIRRMKDLLTTSDPDDKAVKDLEKQISSAASDLSMTVTDSIVSADQVLTSEQRKELHKQMIRSTFGGGIQHPYHHEVLRTEK